MNNSSLSFNDSGESKDEALAIGSPPLVSILVPVYNYESFVQETISSIWEQTYPNMELIVVDDGSTDGSREILEQLEQKSPIRFVLINSDHVGVCGALNLALRAASGKYAAIVHADDIHLPTKIEKQVAALEQNELASISHTEYLCIDSDGRDIKFASRERDLPPARGFSLIDILDLRSDVRSVSIVFRISSLMKYGGYDESLPNEDWQSILRLVREGSVEHIDEELVLRRVHSRNRDINRTRRPTFSVNQIAPGIIKEVKPEHLELSRLLAKHVGSIITSSIVSRNFHKAWQASKYSMQSFGLSALGITLNAMVRGFLLRFWHGFLSKALPTGISYLLVDMRQGFRMRRLRRMEGSFPGPSGRLKSDSDSSGLSC